MAINLISDFKKHQEPVAIKKARSIQGSADSCGLVFEIKTLPQNEGPYTNMVCTAL